MSRKKTVFAFVILLFAGITLSVQIGKEFRAVAPLTLPDGVNVICTHATVRCPTCLITERLTQEVLSEHFQQTPISFHAVNYERPYFAELAKRFKIATATVLLVNVQNSQVTAGKTLTDETWKYYTDAPAFQAMLKENLDAFLQGKTVQPTDPTETFVFESEEEEELVEEPVESLSALSDEELDRWFGVEESNIGKTPEDYVWIVYFHRLPECAACRTMSLHLQEFFSSRLPDEVKRRRIVFRYRNFEDGANAALVQKLKIAGPALVVMLVKDKKPVQAKLAGQIWSLTAEQQELFDYLGEMIQEYLGE